MQLPLATIVAVPLFEPIQSRTVSATPDQVVVAVAIDVKHEDRDAAVAMQCEFRVPLPTVFTRIGRLLRQPRRPTTSPRPSPSMSPKPTPWPETSVGNSCRSRALRRPRGRTPTTRRTSRRSGAHRAARRDRRRPAAPVSIGPGSAIRCTFQGPRSLPGCSSSKASRCGSRRDQVVPAVAVHIQRQIRIVIVPTADFFDVAEKVLLPVGASNQAPPPTTSNLPS